MTSIQLIPRAYTSASEMIATAREIRARLNAGRPVPVQSVIQAIDHVEPRPDPDTLPVALTQPYRRVVMAVAGAAELAPRDVLGGLSEAACRARSIAVAVAVRRYLLRPEIAADRMGLGHDAVANALCTIDAVLSRTVASVKWSDLEPFVALCVSRWPTIEDIRAAVPIHDIKRAFAKAFGISVSDLDSTRRHKSVCRPRQMAIACAKRLTAHSLPEIAERFGGRDHTTILHACRKYSALVERVATTLPATATAMDWAVAMRSAS